MAVSKYLKDLSCTKLKCAHQRGEEWGSGLNRYTGRHNVGTNHI